MTSLLAAAKNLYDHGKFGTLEQAEFFKSVAELAPAADPEVESTKVVAKSKAKAKAKDEEDEEEQPKAKSTKG
jgi:hypothetical protein